MIGKLLRRLVLAAALPALIFTSAHPALAAPPRPVDPQTFPDLPAGIACPDFALRLEQSGGNLHVKEFTDRNGNPVKAIQAGKGFLLTFTNLGPDVDNPVVGKSISIRTDGSVSKTTNNPDGTVTVTATGHNGFIIFPTDVPAGPATIVYTGRVVFNVDPATQVFTLVSESGRKRDVCAELA
jgi:hypothetical protein